MIAVKCDIEAKDCSVAPFGAATVRERMPRAAIKSPCPATTRLRAFRI